MEGEGYLKIILGPMTSGKTTMLINEYYRHQSIKLKCCFINYIEDKKRCKKGIYTHRDNYNITNIFYIKNLLDMKNEINNFDVIFINEGSFIGNSTILGCLRLKNPITSKSIKKVDTRMITGRFPSSEKWSSFMYFSSSLIRNDFWNQVAALARTSLFKSTITIKINSRVPIEFIRPK